jgi:lactate dehydrogenase-like 2-hydroxyacid dehydrogenase
MAPENRQRPISIGLSELEYNPRATRGVRPGFTAEIVICGASASFCFLPLDNRIRTNGLLSIELRTRFSMPLDIVLTGPVLPNVANHLDASFRVREVWKLGGLPALPADLRSNIRAVVGAGHDHVGAEFFNLLPALEIVASIGVGYEHIDAREAARRGILVTNTPDVLTDEVADFAVGLLIATLRQLPQADRFVRAGRWPAGEFPLTPTLRNRKIGIVGLGRIGRAVAHRLAAFGVSIAYHGRNPQAGVSYPYYSSLIELARDVDTLVSVVPGGASTHHLITSDVLEALGPDGVVINVGRGSTIDERALLAALKDGTILSAGLDVFENEPHIPPEFLELDQMVLLPHVGSGSVLTREAMGQLMIDNLTSWFEGKGPLTPVVETPWQRRK